MKSFPIHLFTQESGALTPEIWATPPPALQRIHVQGSMQALRLLEQLPTLGLTVVGTRLPQRRAIEFVKARIGELQDGPWIILSGLARGIDAAAHEAALKAGLPTIAVLGCGLSKTYPPEHSGLRERILEAGGLIISEFQSSEPVYASHFLHRNRLLAAWARAVWVAQAPARSGALNTARWAREWGRDLYSTPTYPDDPAFAGNQRLLDDDHALALWGIHSLGNTWLELATWQKPHNRTGKLQQDLNQHLRVLKSRPRSPSTLDMTELLEAVCRLTLQYESSTFDRLLEWAFSQGWSAERFFTALEQAQAGGELRQEGPYLRPVLPTASQY